MPKLILDEGQELTSLLVVDVFGRDLSVEYRVHECTTGFVNEVTSVTEALLRLLTDWALERGGEKVPLTAEGLATVPLAIQRRIYAEILEDYDPNAKWVASISATS